MKKRIAVLIAVVMLSIAAVTLFMGAMTSTECGNCLTGSLSCMCDEVCKNYSCGVSCDGCDLCSACADGCEGCSEACATCTRSGTRIDDVTGTYEIDARAYDGGNANVKVTVALSLTFSPVRNYKNVRVVCSLTGNDKTANATCTIKRVQGGETYLVEPEFYFSGDPDTMFFEFSYVVRGTKL